MSWTCSGCGSAMKFVPTVYKTASLPDRLSLSAGPARYGRHRTAAKRQRRVHVSVSTSWRRMSHSSCGRSAAWRGSRYKAQPKYTYKGEQRIGKPAFRVGISLPPEYAPFRLARKMARYTPRTKYLPTRAIIEVEYDQDCEMMCIAVDAPDKLFLIDDFIVTHNTVQVIAHVSAQGDRRRVARAGHRADVGDAYVGERDQEVRAVAADAAAAVGERPRGEVRDAARLRRRRHLVCAGAARCAAARAVPLPHAGARRGAEHQESRLRRSRRSCAGCRPITGSR